MQRKANKKDRHFIVIPKEKVTEARKACQELKKLQEVNDDIFAEIGYGFKKKQSQPSIYNKAKTILCQIFCFWK